MMHCCSANESFNYASEYLLSDSISTIGFAGLPIFGSGVIRNATAIGSSVVVAGDYTWHNGSIHNSFYDGVTQRLRSPNGNSFVTGINDCEIVESSGQPKESLSKMRTERNYVSRI
jgi:hypothetical protein